MSSIKVTPFVARQVRPPTREELEARKAATEGTPAWLQVKVPSSLRDAFKRHAIDRGTTVQALLLRMVRDELNG